MAKNDNNIPVPELPQYELPSYEPVEFTMPKFEITDEQIERKMLEFAETYGADYEPTNRKVVGPKENLSFDIEIRKDGEVIPNLSSEERLYTLGDGLMPIDFDRNVVGMKVGEHKEFTFRAPDFDDLAAHAERDFEASVTIKAIMKKKKPEITDEWVARYMPLYKDAADMKEQTRKGMMAEAERMIENEKRERAAYALAERFEGKIDDYWYETTRADLMRTYEEQAKQQGMDLEDLLGKQGVDQQQFSMMLMLQTRQMLTQGFSLDAWARHYNITATEDDIVEMANMMSNGRGKEMVEKLKEDGDERQMEGLRIAACRFLANKDLTARSTIIEEGTVQQ